MSPHPELVQEYPQPFCLAQPGEEYCHLPPVWRGSQTKDG